LQASDQEIRFRARDGVLLSARGSTPSGLTDAPALILLHGAASNGGRWWDFVEHSQLANSHRILRPDLRGHGHSSYTGMADMQIWCADLLDLLAAQGLRQALIGGHCLGANLAAQFAAHYPQCCAGLILIEPMHRPALLGSLARVSRFAPLIRAALPVIRLLNRFGLQRRELQRVDLRALDMAHRALLQSGGGNHALKQRYASPRHDLRCLHLGQYLTNLLEVLRPLPLAGLHLPTLALLSQGRFMADPDLTRVALSAVPDIRVESLAAEHWIPTEQPDAMRATIDGWVRESS
jgi:pimeloyl-ACP methyl ester carboxylesterase